MWGSSEFENYVVEPLSESGDGLQAYRAVDQSDGSRVTLLVDREAESGEPAFGAFDRESGIRRRCQGVSGIERTLFEARTKGGVPYLVLPERTTGTVRSLTDSRRISIGEAVEIALAVGSTVSALNDRGVVVSTIDPASVSMESPPMLQDLSQARVSGLPAEALPRTEAPEVVRGQPPTPLTDVWAVGSFLQQLLRSGPGVSPAGGGSVEPAIPEKLADAITRALSIEPIDRQQDVKVFLDAVSAAMDGVAPNPYPITHAPAPVEQDDDPTVQANEDLIRQIRVASAAPAPQVAPPDDDPTVVANEDLIRQIRAASAPPQSQSTRAAQPEEDPTVVADEDLVRQIRAAALEATDAPIIEDDDETVNADESLIREIREATADVEAAVPPDDATVMAGEDLVRQIRVAGTAAVTPPMDEPPEIVPIATSRISHRRVGQRLD